MYARGILFGKLKYELGDHAVVRCPETGLEADIEFKVKGWMGGTYNAIGGFIKDSKSGKNLFELSGFWHGEMHIKDLATGKKELLFDASKAQPSLVQTRPINEQTPRESQRLWDPTTRAIKKADQKVATDEKSKVEDEQRRDAAERGEGHVWQPFLFKAAPPGDEEKLDWIINATVDDQAPPQKQIEQILAIASILPGQGQQGSASQQANAAPSSQGRPAQEQSQQAAAFQQGNAPQGRSGPPPQQQQQQQSQQAGGNLIGAGQQQQQQQQQQYQPSAGPPPNQRQQQQQQPMSFIPNQPAQSGDKNLATQMGNVNLQHQQPGPPMTGDGIQPPPAAATSNGTTKPRASNQQRRGPGGNPVRRMDSMGNEDTFIDAEM